MRTTGLPPGVGAGEKVVLFDGVCKLCNGWARFLIKHDRRQVFRLAPIQSNEGQAILKWFGLPRDDYRTLYLIEGKRCYQRSAAVIRVLARLPPPWKLLALGWIIPAPLRNGCYDWVARHRYRWFGRYKTTRRPNSDHPGRYLK